MPEVSPSPATATKPGAPLWRRRLPLLGAGVLVALIIAGLWPLAVPVETGALRDSVHLWRVWGDGRQAEAIAGPNIVYADFRDRGGTIRIRRAKVLSDGERFFGKQVTQEGSHYMLRAKVSSEGPIANACRLVVDKFISLEG